MIQEIALDLRTKNDTKMTMFKETVMNAVKKLFMTENSNKFVVKDNKGLYVFNTLDKETVISKIENELTNGCLKFNKKPVEKGRELLLVELSEEVFSFNNEVIKDINFRFLNSQACKGTATGINTITAYMIDGEEKVNKFKSEMDNTSLSDKAKEYLLDEFYEYSSIFSNLNTILSGEILSIAENIKDAINYKELSPEFLSKDTIIDYLKNELDNKLADDLVVKVNSINNNYDITISLLNNSDKIIVSPKDFIAKIK